LNLTTLRTVAEHTAILGQLSYFGTVVTMAVSQWITVLLVLNLDSSVLHLDHDHVQHVGVRLSLILAAGSLHQPRLVLLLQLVL